MSAIMAISVLLLFGLIFLGGIIGLVILLTSPAMRGVAAVLLAIAGIVVVLSIVVAATMFFSVHSTHKHWTEVVEVQSPQRAAVDARAEADHHALGMQTASDANDEADPVVAEPAPGEPPPWLEGKSTWTRDGVYWTRVRVGPYPRDEAEPDRSLPRPVSVSELRQALQDDPLLNEMFQATVDQAVAQYTGHLDPERQVPLELPDSFVLERLVAEAWQSAAPGPEAIPLEPAPQYSDMIDLYLLLKFDATARHDISALRREAIVRDRIGALGGILLIVLLVLGIVLLYLKARRPASPPKAR